MKTAYDVIVAGSGPAGFSAAYYAAKSGADVLLLEKGGTIGGMLTTGHLGVFCGRASAGLYDEAGKIYGQYRINEKDISAGRVFDDWVVSHARYVWGTHNLYGPIGGKSQELSRKRPFGELPCDTDYTIPFKALRPLETGNLLLAGRCISGTFLAFRRSRRLDVISATSSLSPHTPSASPSGRLVAAWRSSRRSASRACRSPRSGIPPSHPRW